MGTKKLDTETRQTQIVKEALGIIAQHGLEGLSVAGLGHRTGLVPSGIYRHFEGKDQIILAVLDLVRDRLYGYLQAVRQEASDPVDRLRRLFVRHLNLLKDNPGIPRVVFSGAVFSTETPNQERAREIIEAYLTEVAELIRVGQEHGRIRSDTDPATLSVMFLGLILPIVILSRITRKEFDWNSHAEQAWRIFSEAIEAPVDGVASTTPRRGKELSTRGGIRKERSD